jgi:hypothetical protein
MIRVCSLRSLPCSMTQYRTSHSIFTISIASPHSNSIIFMPRLRVQSLVKSPEQPSACLCARAEPEHKASTHVTRNVQCCIWLLLRRAPAWSTAIFPDVSRKRTTCCCSCKLSTHSVLGFDLCPLPARHPILQFSRWTIWLLQTYFSNAQWLCVFTQLIADLHFDMVVQPFVSDNKTQNWKFGVSQRIRPWMSSKFLWLKYQTPQTLVWTNAAYVLINGK